MESVDTLYEDALLLEHGFRLTEKPDLDCLEFGSKDPEIDTPESSNVIWGSSITIDAPHYLLEDESLSDLHDRMQRRKQNKSQAYDRYRARLAARKYDIAHESEHLTAKVTPPQQAPPVEERTINTKPTPAPTRGRTKRIQRVFNGLVALSLSTIALSVGGVTISGIKSVSERNDGNAAMRLGDFNKANADYANSNHDTHRAYDFAIGGVGGLVLLTVSSVGDYAEERSRNRRKRF